MQQKCDAWKEEVEKVSPLQDLPARATQDNSQLIREVARLRQDNSRLEAELTRASADNTGGRRSSKQSSTSAASGSSSHKHHRRSSASNRSFSPSGSGGELFTEVTMKDGVTRNLVIKRPRHKLNCKSKPEVIVKRKGGKYETGVLAYVGVLDGKEMAGVILDLPSMYVTIYYTFNYMNV
ncbi:hypothetical protein GBAR_LOCUS14681 [Geodia barretti]|uniref:Uncharacterized protein n=1 Tax=Geodia barretti TaxID=519541 RepID=A0AA35SBB0_GEOBA|nr:hypothetical protein GBAR_LOCUS14681 [Geodia barretti]